MIARITEPITRPAGQIASQFHTVMLPSSGASPHHSVALPRTRAPLFGLPLPGCMGGAPGTLARLRGGDWWLARLA